MYPSSTFITLRCSDLKSTSHNSSCPSSLTSISQSYQVYTKTYPKTCPKDKYCSPFLTTTALVPVSIISCLDTVGISSMTSQLPLLCHQSLFSMEAI